jgi:hypothetical protein
MGVRAVVGLAGHAADEQAGTRAISGATPSIVTEAAAIVADDGTGRCPDDRAIDGFTTELRLRRHKGREGEEGAEKSFHGEMSGNSMEDTASFARFQPITGRRADPLI